jgi:hypothetical protein
MIERVAANLPLHDGRDIAGVQPPDYYFMFVRCKSVAFTSSKHSRMKEE